MNKIYDKLTASEYKEILETLRKRYEGQTMTIERALDFQVDVFDYLFEKLEEDE